MLRRRPQHLAVVSVPLASRLAGVLAVAALVACSDPVSLREHRTPTSPNFSTAAASDGRFVVLSQGSGFQPGFAASVAALGGSVDALHDGAGLAVVSGLSDAAAAALRGTAGVSSVDANGVIQLDPEEVVAPDAVADALPASAISSQANPATAFFYPRQWDYRAISAPSAWAAGKVGSSTVKVAILDTGIDYTYPDLNGLVDLANSTSFVPSDDALVAANFPGKNSCTDLHFHGTHVASTVSSKAVVIAGVTSRTTLMCVKVLGANGSGDDAGVLQGILWAADHGADVINMSLGSEFARAGSGRQRAAINRAINYAFSKGTLVVVAAGNAAEDLDHNGNNYVSLCDAANVVCVSATGPTAGPTNGPWTNIDAPAFYTNFGRSSISVAAPGGNFSSVWQACSQTTMLPGLLVCRTGIFVVGARGTSMAAPHVSGLAALLVNELGSGNPARIRTALQKSADDLGQLGTDPFYGKGRINVKTALGL